MKKFYFVAKQEYRNRTFTRSFIVGTLIIPIMIAVIIGVTILIIERSKDDRPFGYVDYSGALANTSMQKDPEDSVEIISYLDEESVRKALEAEEIQGYHLIPEDYLENLKVDLYYLEEAPTSKVLKDFDDFIRANILDTPPTPTQVRIMEGSNLTVQAINENREFQDNDSGIVMIMLPLMIAMFFLFAVMGASGYFLRVVMDEKESRTMEIMITSVSPVQLIAGKSVGLVAVGLTQLLLWITSIAIAFNILQPYIEILKYIQLPWDILIIFAIFFLPTYAIIAGLMICIGSVVTELQEGQQISGILNLLFTFPIFFAALVFADPNNPLLIFLSFWPTTSVITIIMRWGFTRIPTWQLALSWFTCVITGTLLILMASYLFRLGMLRYGQRLTVKSILVMLSAKSQQEIDYAKYNFDH